MCAINNIRAREEGDRGHGAVQLSNEQSYKSLKIFCVINAAYGKTPASETGWCYRPPIRFYTPTDFY